MNKFNKNTTNTNKTFKYVMNIKHYSYGPQRKL